MFMGGAIANIPCKSYTGHKILYQKYMGFCCTTCAIFLLMWLMLFFSLILKTKIDTHIPCCCLQKWKMLSIKEHPMQIIKKVCSITNYNSMSCPCSLNSLASERCVGNFTIAFLNSFHELISWSVPIDVVPWDILKYFEMCTLATCFLDWHLVHLHCSALRWIPQDSIDDQPIMVQVMAWCLQNKKLK